METVGSEIRASHGTTTSSFSPLEKREHEPFQNTFFNECKLQSFPAQTIIRRQGGEKELELQNLPGKVLENCQRTARVVIISELEKKLNKDKRAKTQLFKILSEFVPKHVNRDLGQYAEERKYYNSLNYSRVRIGHKQFVKKILSHSGFQRCLLQIFDSDALYRSEKARKNERSPISFELRKKILERVLLEYKEKFLSLSSKQESMIDPSTYLETQILMEEKSEENIDFHKNLKPNFPIIPIPLPPQEYQLYMASKITL